MKKLVWIIASCSLCLLFGAGLSPIFSKRGNCERKVEKSRYIGAYRCKGCHESAYRKWKESAHARAYQSLPLKFRKNKLCLSCHSLGRESHLLGVQCENCHGGGRYYSLPEVMVDKELARAAGLKVSRARRECTTCHRLPFSHKKFSYKEYWKKISHIEKQRSR